MYLGTCATPKQGLLNPLRAHSPLDDSQAHEHIGARRTMQKQRNSQVLFVIKVKKTPTTETYFAPEAEAAREVRGLFSQEVCFLNGTAPLHCRYTFH